VELMRALTESLESGVRAESAAAPPDAARYLWTDRWVGYPRADRILTRLEDFLTLPPRIRMPNMLIHGASGVGKSMVLAKFLRDHQVRPDERRQAGDIVAFQMPPMPSLRSFFAQMLRSLECTVIIGSRLSELEQDALQQLEADRPRLIAIDEIHHLLACTPREQRDEALHVMRTDPQIASRFERFELPPWEPSEELRSFIAGFIEQLGLKSDRIVTDQIAVEYLLDLTSGITGRMVEVLRLSSRRALHLKTRTLSLEHLQFAGKHFADDLARL
jgi:hypothetical protein